MEVDSDNFWKRMERKKEVWLIETFIDAKAGQNHSLPSVIIVTYI